MITTDAPDHTRLRALVGQAFTPRFVEQMRDRIRALTDQLLDPLQGQGRFDLIRDFAVTLLEHWLDQYQAQQAQKKTPRPPPS